MPNKEIPLQRDMFTGKLVDTRTPKQKRNAKRREQPQQREMFSQRELAQFGVKANPKMPLSPKTRLELAMEDPRSEEEKERDRMKAAQALTHPLFGDQEATDGNAPKAAEKTIAFPSGEAPLVSPEEPGGEPLVRFFDDLTMVLWSTPDQAFERLELLDWHRGYRGRRVGEWQLEITEDGILGYYLLTYSDMGRIEDVEWVEGKG
jgi:hypothetical protein